MTMYSREYRTFFRKTSILQVYKYVHILVDLNYNSSVVKQPKQSIRFHLATSPAHFSIVGPSRTHLAFVVSSVRRFAHKQAGRRTGRRSVAPGSPSFVLCCVARTHCRLPHIPNPRRDSTAGAAAWRPADGRSVDGPVGGGAGRDPGRQEGRPARVPRAARPAGSRIC
jgi:hypothetical protein